MERRVGFDRRRSSELDGLGVERLRHDVRQPLSAVMLLVAAMETEPALPPQIRRRLQQIQGEAEWMAEILSSTEEGASSVRRLELGNAIERTCRAVAAAASCDVRFTQVADVDVVVDPVALRRAVRNLLDNAVRAVGDGGSVEVRVRRDDDCAVLEVADSGPGFGRMPRQQGLGLLTVRQFVERHHGTLEVGTSTLGGALVTLRWPLVSVERRVTTLLVVEGEPA
ncbi:MAG: hypothetical protein GEU96_04390 [Propionibacteriales bacterium]|nr:hypothetical protein [Propionibacteriales bacterium]